MIDSIAHLFLTFTSQLLLMPLLVSGFIWLDRRLFYRVLSLLLVGMIINVALKITFQIPLSISLGKPGFAFPSGHMQLATLLYAQLAYENKYVFFKILMVILLTGIGSSLIYFGYHNFYDVLGGLFVALFLLAFYELARLKLNKKMPLMLLIVATIALIYCCLRYPHVPPHAWMAYYTLFGLIVAETMFDSVHITLYFSQKIVATLICILAIAIIYYVFQFQCKHFPMYLKQLKWLFTGFILPGACYLVVLCTHNKV